MGFERIPGTDVEYGLISYDAQGRERVEDGGLMSERLLAKARNEGTSHVFFFCHGWKGDLPAAREQYGRWMGAFLQSADHMRARSAPAGFRPQLIGLHWPSLPWGDEELRAGSFGAAAKATAALLDTYLARLGDRPEIRRPLQVILDEARHNIAPARLPPHVRQAYVDLDHALGLGSEGVSAPPDADREAFDPDEAYEAANEEGASFGDLDLGGVLGPLRQLSYWTMKKRARTVGEGGMHAFLASLQQASPASIHLMGHSFGTIVVSGMLGGPDARGSLPRPVDSLVLVQGAVSLWCYASPIPFDGAGDGYFAPILSHGKVSGPIVTTRSKHDSAVGTFYPLASRFGGTPSFAAQNLPKYGAIGSFGLRGIGGSRIVDMPMLPADGDYDFEKGRVYNLEASAFIAQKEGASGAHSDIDGPEVAHAIWAAALAAWEVA